MSNFVGNLKAQGFTSTDIVYIGNVFTSQEPTLSGSTSAIKEDLAVILEKLNGTEFSRVLLRMVGFCELILHEVLPIDLGGAFALLNLGVVPVEYAWYALIMNKILVGLGHVAFQLHPLHIEHMGVHAIEDLGACGFPKSMCVGKVCICGH